MSRRRRGLTVAAVVALLALLVAAVLLTMRWWVGDSRIGLHGYLAMTAAVLGVSLLAGGLMWLAFHSSRAGWDDIDRD